MTVNLSVRNEIKAEWENLRKHDVCFLITVRPTSPIGKMQPVELDPESVLALCLSTDCGLVKASTIVGKTLTVFKYACGTLCN